MPNQKSFGGVYKNPSSVSGLSINDIMSLDPNRLKTITEKELRQITSRLVSAANKRISRMGRNDRAINPAIQAAGSSGLLNKSGKFSTRKVEDFQKLKKVFYGTMSFLKKETSTAKGFKEWKKKVQQTTASYIKDSAQSHDEKVKLAWQKVYAYYNYDTQSIKEHYKEIFDLIHANVDIYDTADDLFDAILGKLDDIMSMEYEDIEDDYGEFFRPEDDGEDDFPF